MKTPIENGVVGQDNPVKTLTKYATDFIAFLLFRALLVLAFVGGFYAAS